jgi:hypothetical protein
MKCRGSRDLHLAGMATPGSARAKMGRGVCRKRRIYAKGIEVAQASPVGLGILVPARGLLLYTRVRICE